VSLLDRLAHGHLSDVQLAKYWTEMQAEGSVDPHLASCEECRARYAAFERWITGIGDELRSEADDAFTADRLAVQQSQVARRLETLERPARVIAFPKAARAVISGHSHVRRWVTVAAAAGLIAGIGLGQVVPEMRHALDNRRNGPTAVLDAPLSAARNARAEKARTIAASPSDDELLEDSFGRPRVSALSALDDMTPHVRDIVDQSQK
jgi:anti-sigma factor RsiW